MQRLEQKMDKMMLENRDHKDNFKELNTKYQNIIETYLTQIEEKDSANQELGRNSKVLAQEVKKQRGEIDRLTKSNHSLKDSLASFKNVFQRSAILDKLQVLAKRIN